VVNGVVYHCVLLLLLLQAPEPSGGGGGEAFDFDAHIARLIAASESRLGLGPDRGFTEEQMKVGGGGGGMLGKYVWVTSLLDHKNDD